MVGAFRNKAACGIAAMALAFAGAAVAQDSGDSCDPANLPASISGVLADPTALLSDPTQLISVLPDLFPSSDPSGAVCQGDIIGAGANCLSELTGLVSALEANSSALVGVLTQAVSDLDIPVNVSDVTERMEAGEPVNVTEILDIVAQVGVLSEEQIKPIVDEILPIVKAGLPDGKISDMCCSLLAPVNTDNCLCGETLGQLIYCILPEGTNLNTYSGIIDAVMAELQCPDALKGLKIWVPEGVTPAPCAA